MSKPLDGLWVPKKVSNDILQLVGELNNYLGGNYFVATLTPTSKGNYIYQLDYTLWAREHNMSYSYLCIDETQSYKHKEMKAYLLGLTQGIYVGINL